MEVTVSVQAIVPALATGLELSVSKVKASYNYYNINNVWRSGKHFRTTFLYQHVGSYVTRKMLNPDFDFLFQLKDIKRIYSSF